MTGRDQKILDMYMDGYSLTDVGKEFGLTRQRIHQIISPLSKERHHGGLRRQKYAAKISAAYERVLSHESTLSEEAERLGMKPNSLRLAFRVRGLRIPRRQAPLHGTRYRYSQGCRCDECRAAAVKYQRTFLGREPPIHGTASAYSNYGCRCRDCRAAQSRKNREYRERRKAIVAR